MLSGRYRRDTSYPPKTAPDLLGKLVKTKAFVFSIPKIFLHRVLFRARALSPIESPGGGSGCRWRTLAALPAASQPSWGARYPNVKPTKWGQLCNNATLYNLHERCRETCTSLETRSKLHRFHHYLECTPRPGSISTQGMGVGSKSRELCVCLFHRQARSFSTTLLLPWRS